VKVVWQANIHLIDGGLLKKYCFVKLLNHNSTLIGKTIIVSVQDLIVLDYPGGILCSPMRLEPLLDEPKRLRQKNKPVSCQKLLFNKV